MRAANKISAAFALVLSLAARPGALEITNAGLSGPASSAKADIVFSGAISVKNIALKKDAVVMPLTVYKEREYADIKLLSKGLYWKLRSCFDKGGCGSKAKAAVPAIKVEGVRVSTASARAANVEVSFDGELKVVFGVVKNLYGGLWVAYPPDFKVKGAPLKGAIAKAVMEAYTKAVPKLPDK